MTFNPMRQSEAQIRHEMDQMTDEKLLAEIALSHDQPAYIPHRIASQILRERQAKRDADREQKRTEIEASRHAESMNASSEANRLARWATIIALGALVIAIFAWLRPV